MRGCLFVALLFLLANGERMTVNERTVAVPESVCDDCKEVVTYIESWLDQNATEGDIERYLNVLCRLVPAWQGICVEMEDAGIQYVIQYIVEHENPTMVCQDIGVCSARKRLVMKDSLRQSYSAECRGCTSIVGYVESLVLNDHSAAEIEQALDALCPLLPNVKPACGRIVTQGVPVVMEWINKNYNSLEICQGFGICSTGNLPPTPTQPPSVKQPSITQPPSVTVPKSQNNSSST